MNIKVVGGQMVFKTLTNQLPKRMYAIQKASLWAQMLNDRQKPTKWLKPTRKGTKVNFNVIYSKDEYKEAMNELEVFLSEINEQYNLDLKVHWQDENDKEGMM